MAVLERQRREAEDARAPETCKHEGGQLYFSQLGAFLVSWRPLGASGRHLGGLGAMFWQLGVLYSSSVECQERMTSLTDGEWDPLEGSGCPTPPPNRLDGSLGRGSRKGKHLTIRGHPMGLAELCRMSEVRRLFFAARIDFRRF